MLLAVSVDSTAAAAVSLEKRTHNHAGDETV